MSTTQTSNLKNERINETNTAANTTATQTTEPKAEQKTATPATAPTTPSASDPKKDMMRMIGYPIVIGGVGAVGGMLLANKLGKDKKMFIIGGFVVGAAIGFALYKRWEKKNTK